MAIVPNGKARMMVAQNFSNPLMEGYSDGVPNSEPQQVNGDPQFATYDDLQNGFKDKEPSLDENDDKRPSSLTDFIFKKLQDFGYPGRRLEEFKKKFVKESISPDGIKNLTIEIPDKYYPDEQGNIKTIETEELSKIVKEIGKLFGLNFNGADRSDGKWSINLTSAKKEEKEEVDGLGERDGLEDVYGPSESNPGKKNNKKSIRAFSIQEMIKAEKNDVVDKLQKILEKK